VTAPTPGNRPERPTYQNKLEILQHHMLPRSVEVAVRPMSIARPRCAGETPTVVAAIVLACLCARSASGQEYDVSHQAKNQVRFVSTTTVQAFDGVTEHIDGYVKLGSSPLSAASASGSDLYLEVDLASLDTGIGLRNRHMRDDYLEVKKYPYATYKGRIAQVRQGDGSSQVTAEGTLSIHGVDRPASVQCDVDTAGAGYHASCAFQLLLSDYDIKIPKVMFLKLNNEIRLELDFTVAPVGGNGDAK
jgi:polyisoprenoid-binding protein YceI